MKTEKFVYYKNIPKNSSFEIPLLFDLRGVKKDEIFITKWHFLNGQQKIISKDFDFSLKCVYDNSLKLKDPNQIKTITH